jgi:hypothetical protein
MTAQELINEALVKIDQDGSNGFFSNADLLSILNEGYRDLVRFTEALEKDTETTTTALEAVVSLPSDFLSGKWTGTFRIGWKKWVGQTTRSISTGIGFV